MMCARCLIRKAEFETPKYVFPRNPMTGTECVMKFPLCQTCVMVEKLKGINCTRIKRYWWQRLIRLESEKR